MSTPFDIVAPLVPHVQEIKRLKRSGTRADSGAHALGQCEDAVSDGRETGSAGYPSSLAVLSPLRCAAYFFAAKVIAATGTPSRSRIFTAFGKPKPTRKPSARRRP